MNAEIRSLCAEFEYIVANTAEEANHNMNGVLGHETCLTVGRPL
jgi:hypothetical protein